MNDNDFVFYKINDDLTTSPVYKKISLDFLGEDKLGQVHNTIQDNSSNIDEYTGYFYKSQGTWWRDPGAFVNRGKIEKLTADFIGNELQLGTSDPVEYGGAMQNGASYNRPGSVNLLVGDL